jgi:hypothetical protein|tara:strand:+ start:2895 stop:4886 length:1992 start_codon:yes stop_codon:yes gene_type:complete
MSVRTLNPESFSAFDPVHIGNTQLRNRIFVPAHTTNFGLGHMPTDTHVAYHEARARGGAGLIIMESLRVHETSLGKPQGLAAYDPRCIEPLRLVANAVQSHGTRIFGQIIHLGRQIDGDALRLPSWGPSAIAWDAAATAPHVMNLDDIEAVIGGHTTSARNVLEAGFDGLEVHLGHGHLLNQFLSPATNHRSDEFGGEEPNRMRFPLQVLAAVREEIGADTCMGIRISADEFAQGGLTLEDMCRIVPAITASVPVDFVNVSHSAYHGTYSLSTQMADMSFDPNSFRHLAPRIRKSLRAAGQGLPVMAVCKFRSIDEAEELLSVGAVDLVGMARAHIADPAVVHKTYEGRTDEVRTCIGCNQGCAGFLEKGLPITCVVNPTVGKERFRPTEPIEDPAKAAKRVVVVGGGPAGMEAAWVAAARGHDVELFETEPQLGGQLSWLRHMPKRNDFLTMIDQQIAACERHGVTIRTSAKFDATVAIEHEKQPDHIVIATGSELQPVEFPQGGVGLTLGEALSADWTGGIKVAFYDLLGDWSSISVVEHIADLGADVTYLTPVAGYAWKITRYSKTAITSRLREAGVGIRVLRAGLSFIGNEFTVEDLSTGKTECITVDAVIAAGNPAARTDQYERIAVSGIGVTLVGDCLAPRSALEAVYDGHEVGRAL